MNKVWLGATWHWYGCEYQSRGSTHTHGSAKLSNDPGIYKLVEKAATAWALSNEGRDMSQAVPPSEPDDPTGRAEIIRGGEEAKALVIQYSDWLVTTWNEALPDESWRHPVPHPCATSIRDAPNVDEDYHTLVNTVQRHTHCNAAYCLRTKHGKQTPTCRFNYPRPTQSESSLSFERLSDGTIRATLTTRRNDSRINSHSRLLLQHWRANVDLQIIVDIQACAWIFAAKGEPHSQAGAQI